MTFDQWVRGTRETKRETRKVAAAAIGVSMGTLQNWETGRAFPRSLNALRGLVRWSGDPEGFAALVN